MAKNGGLGKLLAGLGLGIGIGLLISPKSGKENIEDLKKASKKAVDKIKNTDLNEVKDNLISEFNKLKKELKNMDADKAKKLAKEKGNELMDKANELIAQAKEKAEPVIEKETKELKKNLSEFLANMSEKVAK